MTAWLGGPRHRAWTAAAQRERQPHDVPGDRAGGAAVDAVFRETDAHRLWLGVFPDNARARRVYEALGFRPEGLARGSASFGGVHRDDLVMALLRPEWAARGSRDAGDNMPRPLP